MFAVTTENKELTIWQFPHGWIHNSFLYNMQQFNSFLFFQKCLCLPFRHIVRYRHYDCHAHIRRIYAHTAMTNKAKWDSQLSDMLEWRRWQRRIQNKIQCSDKHNNTSDEATHISSKDLLQLCVEQGQKMLNDDFEKKYNFLLQLSVNVYSDFSDCISTVT